MNFATWILLVALILILIGLGLAIKIVKQYEKGLFRLGRLKGSREPGRGSSSR